MINIFGDQDYINSNAVCEILDYLLKCKAISIHQFEEVSREEDLKDKNLRLLSAVQSNIKDYPTINVLGFFLNSLRTAGYHALANKIDNAGVCGFSPKSRRKGQISLILQVSALQVKIKELVDRKSLTGSDKYLNSIWIDGIDVIDGDQRKIKDDSKTVGTFFSLLCCIRRRKVKKTNNSNNNNNIDRIEMESKKKKNDLNSQIAKMQQQKRDMLLEKSKRFYELLLKGDGTTTEEWIELVKHMEQQQKTLVFQRQLSEDKSAVEIILFCTTLDNIEKLRSAVNSGILERQLTKLLLSQRILDALDVKNLRLSISLRSEEVDLAVQELFRSR